MNRYDDIIGLPHYEPRHPRMSLENRAAQFAPFAALTGHGAAIAETARLTESMMELSVEEQTRLSRRLNIAYELHAEVTFTFFIPDRRKTGGRYGKVRGVIKKIDEAERFIILEDGYMLPLDFITVIDSDRIDNIDY